MFRQEKPRTVPPCPPCRLEFSPAIESRSDQARSSATSHPTTLEASSDNPPFFRPSPSNTSPNLTALFGVVTIFWINMSGVWGWFGGGAAQKRKDSPKNAILGLRAQLDMLQKRERHLQSQMDEQEGIARKNVNTNKNGRACGNSPRSGTRRPAANANFFSLDSCESCPAAQKGPRTQP